jgi:hypothetical protein
MNQDLCIAVAQSQARMPVILRPSERLYLCTEDDTIVRLPADQLPDPVWIDVTHDIEYQTEYYRRMYA